MTTDTSCPPSQPGGYPSDCEVTQGLLERTRERSAKITRSISWKRAMLKARHVELLLLDVDGVLTDGTLTYTHDGGENKRFHTQDGFGLRLMKESGLQIGLITARSSAAVSRRAADLGIDHVFQGSGQKFDIYTKILGETKLQPLQTAYMGDDWLDLPVLRRVGFSCAPGNGVAEVRQLVDYVTMKQGGSGAVREVCDLILESKGLLKTLLKKYAGQ